MLTPPCSWPLDYRLDGSRPRPHRTPQANLPPPAAAAMGRYRQREDGARGSCGNSAPQELGESRRVEEAPPEGGGAVDEGLCSPRCPADPPPAEGCSKAGVPFPTSSGAAAGAGHAAARGPQRKEM